MNEKVAADLLCLLKSLGLTTDNFDRRPLLGGGEHVVFVKTKSLALWLSVLQDVRSRA